jgi:hypothetical protein
MAGLERLGFCCSRGMRGKWGFVACKRVHCMASIVLLLSPPSLSHTHTHTHRNPELTAILDALHATRATARERQSATERRIREEARKLRQGLGGGEGAAAAAAAAGRKNIDLEDLAFAQGSHFMSNKTCTLPQVRGLRAGTGGLAGGRAGSRAGWGWAIILWSYPGAAYAGDDDRSVEPPNSGIWHWPHCP